MRICVHAGVCTCGGVYMRGCVHAGVRTCGGVYMRACASWIALMYIIVVRGNSLIMVLGSEHEVTCVNHVIRSLLQSMYPDTK